MQKKKSLGKYMEVRETKDQRAGEVKGTKEESVMHDLQLIHTDLKPENILLVSPDTIRVHDYKALNFPIRTWPKFEISRMYTFVIHSFFGGSLTQIYSEAV